MVINHNMSAMQAERLLRFRGKELDTDMERLSSGQRINKGGDDASGLAVSEKLRAQIRGLNQAEKNIENGISFIQTTEGYLGESTDILQRLRELSVQSANGIYSDEDRAQVQVEVSQLVDELNRIASHAEFNGQKLLMGDFSKANTTAGAKKLYLHVGANVDQREQIFIGTMTAAALIKAKGNAPAGQVSLATADSANSTLTSIDDALRTVNKQRADLGAFQNRFQFAAQGVAIAAENMQAAESNIRDTDMANQMVSYTKNQILMQAGTAMLAHANVKTQSVLQLLG